MPSRLFWAVAALAAAVCALYLFLLNGVGVLGPDEPRYAAIGRAMATSGDWITPRLWGSPWFEKPPVLYWLTGIGTKLGLSPELGGRLPVALLSLLSLVAAFFLLRAEYDARRSLAVCFLLATSAGWLVFSGLCLTDLPLAATYMLAMFLVLRRLRLPASPDPPTFAAIGALLGLAVLAKGLVPIVLALPALWFLRRQWRGCLLAICVLLLVAGPWYALVYARNGYPFIEDFFLKHHFQRLYSNSLQHVQPFYYYFPVLLGALFPWTPLFFVPTSWRNIWDSRRLFLLVTAGFGFAFFSISRNKLPGYLLPLVPLCFVLLVSGWESLPRRRQLIAPAILVAFIPLCSDVLVDSLAHGRITWTQFTALPPSRWLYIALPLLAVAFARRQTAPVLLLAALIANGLLLKATVYPALELRVSPRLFWRLTAPVASVTCDAGTNRDWLYGLSFYRGTSYMPCDNSGRFRFALRTLPGRSQPELMPWPEAN